MTFLEYSGIALWSLIALTGLHLALCLFYPCKEMVKGKSRAVIFKWHRLHAYFMVASTGSFALGKMPRIKQVVIAAFAEETETTRGVSFIFGPFGFTVEVKVK